MTAVKINDSIAFEVSADDVDEAVQFAVNHLQALTLERGARGFIAPILVSESFEVVKGEWGRVFRFTSEFLPAVS